MLKLHVHCGETSHLTMAEVVKDFKSDNQEDHKFLEDFKENNILQYFGWSDKKLNNCANNS